jgi:hypothetical protein
VIHLGRAVTFTWDIDRGVPFHPILDNASITPVSHVLTVFPNAAPLRIEAMAAIVIVTQQDTSGNQ